VTFQELSAMFAAIQPIRNRIFALVNAAVALSVLLGVFILINRNQMPDGFGEFLTLRITVKNLILSALFVLVWLVVFRQFRLSRPWPAAPFRTELIQVTKACSVGSAFALIFPLTSHGGAFTVRILICFLPISIMACMCGRLAARGIAVRLARILHGRRNLIIVGSGPRAAALYDHLREPQHCPNRVLGFVDSPNAHVVPNPIQKQMLGTLDDLERILMKQPVDEVLIALPVKSCYDQIQTAIRTCEQAGVEAKYLSDIFALALAHPEVEAEDEENFVALKVVPDDYRLLVKRAIDIVGSMCGLILSAPLMLIIAAAIKLTSPGPIFFAQERYGFNKRRFRMYKFRTMAKNAEKLQASLESRNEVQGPVFKIRNDPRITPLGRILRKTSLDELPQLFNVLKGEMSLVGPRPLPLRDVARFDKGSLMRRFSVKPGLTCLWQINGRSEIQFDRWIQLDLKYIDTWSLALDLKILAKTVPMVIAGSGAE
jgi:exopolysaccharide biosynthesis polyprenyl glycosylphosphotransferase